MAAPLIEAADCTESGNNTATSSWAVSFPNASTGDLLLVHIAWDDSTATTTLTAPAGPNGETFVGIGSIFTDSGTTARGRAGYYIATGSWTAGTLTFTPGASEQWTAVVTRVPAGEFRSVAPIGASNTNSLDSANATLSSPTLDAGAADGDGTAVFFSAIDTVTTNATPSGWTMRIQRDRGAVGCNLSTRDSAVTPSESIASANWTLVSADTAASIVYIVRGPLIMTAGQGAFTLSGQSAIVDRSDATQQGGDPAPLPHLGLLLEGSAAPEITLVHGSFALSGQDADLDADRKLALAHGSFTLSGQAAGVRVGRKIAAAHGAFTLSGQDADLDADRKLALVYGDFALSGQTVGLGSAIGITADAGSFTLSGQDVDLDADRKLALAHATFNLSGQDADIDADRRLALVNGGITLSGQAVVFDYTSGTAQGGDPAPFPHLGLVLQPSAKTITADYGSYALSGQAIGLRVGRGVSGAYGRFTLSGQDVSFARGLVFALEHGDFALSGQSVGLAPLGRIPLEYGTITLSGQSVGLSKQGDLNLVYGDFALSGQAAALTYRRRLPQVFGSYVLSGSVALRAARKIAAGTGSFTLSGQAFTLISRGSAWYPAPFPHIGMLLAPQAGVYSIGAEFGTFTLSGQDVALSTPTLFSIEAGTFTLTGMDADRDISMSSGLGSYTLSGQAVTFSGALSILAERGNFSLTGRDVTFRLLRFYDLAASTGTYTLTGRAAALRYGHKTSAGTASFALSGQAVDLDHDHKLAIGHGAYTVTGYAATLTEGQSLSAATGVFTLTGQSVNLAASFVRLSAETGSFSVTFQDARLKPFRLAIETGEFDLNGSDVTLYAEEPRDPMIGGGVDRSDRRKFKDYLWRKGLRHYRLPLSAGQFALKGRTVEFRRTERHDPFHISSEIRRPLLRLPAKTKAPAPTVDIDALIAAELKYAEELQAQKRKRRRKQDDEILLLM